MLCNACYEWLRKYNRIADFPPIVKLPPKNKWIKKYGEGLVLDLQGLIDGNNQTLSSIGTKYGITRERIRQMFELLHGFKYTVAVRANSEKKKRIRVERRLAKRDPRYKVENFREGSNIYHGAESEKKVFDICAALGYEIKPYPTKTIDIVINGYKVDIKSAHCTTMTHPSGKTPLYHFHLLESQRIADFVICHASPINKFFVIPINEYPKCNHLYIPHTKTMEWKAGRYGLCKQKRESKYYNYLEAWHLLKPKEEVIFNIPEAGCSGLGFRGDHDAALIRPTSWALLTRRIVKLFETPRLSGHRSQDRCKLTII